VELFFEIGEQGKGAVAEFAGWKPAAANVFMQKSASNTSKDARFSDSEGNRYKSFFPYKAPGSMDCARLSRLFSLGREQRLMAN
jgi:hypothetical protein